MSKQSEQRYRKELEKKSITKDSTSNKSSDCFKNQGYQDNSSDGDFSTSSNNVNNKKTNNK